MSATLTQDICSFCSFYDDKYGSCAQLHVNILGQPEKFEKCCGDHFSGEGDESIDEILSEKNYRDNYIKQWVEDTANSIEALQFINRMNRSTYLLFRVLHLICLAYNNYMFRDITKIMIPQDLILIGTIYVLFWIDFFMVVARLHDLGRPGYHYFLSWIPLYNLYFYLMLFFKRGEAFDNRYGECTLGEDLSVEDSLQIA